MAKGTPPKGAGSSRPGGKPGPGGKSGPGGKAGPGGKSTRARKPPPVVSRQPRPWGWIAAAVVVAVFAAGAIGYAVVQVNQRAEAADPANIEGLVTKEFTNGSHTEGVVDYGGDSPPFGGPHAPPPGWADCNGDVYPIPISSEYAVHSLEHGAVWVTYDPELSQDEIAQLAELVEGQSYVFMSPYPGLSSAVSLQSWGNQLKVDAVDDPRIAQYITSLRLNPDFTPEVGASCDNPEFAANPVPASDPSPVPTSGAPSSGASESVDPAAPTGSTPAPTTAP